MTDIVHDISESVSQRSTGNTSGDEELKHSCYFAEAFVQSSKMTRCVMITGF